MTICLIFARYPTNLLARSRYPIIGTEQQPDTDIAAVATSNLPTETNH